MFDPDNTALAMAIWNDDVLVENELALLLDEIATEMITTAKELRRAPYVAIEQRLKKLSIAHSMAIVAGKFLTDGDPEAAMRIIHQVRNAGFEPVPADNSSTEFTTDLAAL